MTIATTARPKNLAQLKRMLTPGDVLIGVWYGWREHRGEPQTPLRLTIEAVNSVAIVFAADGDRPRSWSYFQKAAQYRFTDDGYAIHDADGSKLAEYRYA